MGDKKKKEKILKCHKDLHIYTLVFNLSYQFFLNYSFVIHSNSIKFSIQN